MLPQAKTGLIVQLYKRIEYEVLPSKCLSEIDAHDKLPSFSTHPSTHTKGAWHVAKPPSSLVNDLAENTRQEDTLVLAGQRPHIPEADADRRVQTSRLELATDVQASGRTQEAHHRGAAVRVVDAAADRAPAIGADVVERQVACSRATRRREVAADVQVVALQPQAAHLGTS